MTTLTITSLTPLLDRLFEQDEAARDVMRAAFADVTDADRIRMMQSKTDYRDLYHRLKDAPLAVSRETAHLLYMLARSSRAKAIVEFGTSFGISTLHLAAGLRDNGGGRLITSEFEPSKAARARANLRDGGLIDLVEIREGDALKTLSENLPDQIENIRIERFGAVEQHEVDRIRQIGAERLQRIPFADFDEIEQPAGREAVARPRRLGRLELAGDEAPATIVAQACGKVQGRDAERGAELDDRSGAGAARQHVEQRGGLAGDRERDVLQASVEVGVIGLAPHHSRPVGVGEMSERGSRCAACCFVLVEQAIQQRRQRRDCRGSHLVSP